MKERLQSAAVAVFALVAAGAVVLLLQHRDDAPAAADSSPRPAPAGSALDSAQSPPTGSVVLESGRKGMLLRVRTGSCTEAGGPKLELSTNVGRTFRSIQPPQLDDGGGIDATSPVVPMIVRASAASPRKLTVFAADRSCVVHVYTSTDGGLSWTQKAGRPGAWYTDPKTGHAVSPKGRTDDGCTKSALLAPVDTSTAVVVCRNGDVRRTIDGGGSWAQVGTLDDATALVFAGPTNGFAVTRGDDCASRVQVTTDGGATWRPSGCVNEKFAIPALAVVGDRLVAGGTGGALVSGDQGQTWGPSTKK